MRNERGPVNSLVCSGRERPETHQSKNKQDGAGHYIDNDSHAHKNAHNHEKSSRHMRIQTGESTCKKGNEDDWGSSYHNRRYSPKKLLGLRWKVEGPRKAMDGAEQDRDD